ncbi:MAG TPA: hypothetical protein VKV37_12695 [Ktedonobacteraceae bacterium]|nr:hypothetical protein [Ktedonobacteraceae bacterium]
MQTCDASRFRSWLAVCLLLMALLAACSPANPSSPPATHKAPTAAATRQATLGGPGCHPPSPVDRSSIGIPELQGTAPGGQLWALLFNAVPFPVNKEVKIVWRMTGSGDLHLVALGPNGQRVAPKDLIYHGTSNWTRPGLEWGSIFVFPAPGCWDVHATMDHISGDVWFMVR